MSIALEQHAGEFTQAVVDVYKEEVPTPSFLKNFFTPVTTTTKYVDVRVQRGTEKISVDVNRGGDGIRNKFSLASQKLYLPPFHNEYFDATALDTYDNMIMNGGSPELMGSTVRDIGEKLQMLRDKINRAKELQAAQVFETGIVTMVNGDNIDFKRKAASKVDAGATGGYWTTTTSTIEAQLVAGGDFLRQTGKSPVKEIDAIMSSDAWINLKASDYFTDSANYNQVSLLSINRPIADASGAAYHGQITAGSYIINIWTYDEEYINAAGSSTRYFSEKQVIMLPSAGTRFVMAHAGLPKVIHDPSRVEFPTYITNVASEFGIYNRVDEKQFAHYFGVMSAPVAIPVSVDRIYTLQVIA